MGINCPVFFFFRCLLASDCVSTCFPILLGFVPLPLIFILFTSCQVSLVSCAVFISISGVMFGECADLLGQELPEACRGDDGW